MLKKSLFLSVFFLFSLYIFSYTYYLPHIHTTSDAWETYLIVDNASDKSQAFMVYYMGDDGNELSHELLSVDANSTLKVSLREKNAPWLYIYAGDTRVSFRVGYIAKESLGGGTAEFVLPKGLLKTAMFRLSNYYDKLTWSGFALINALNEPITVTPYLFTDSGVVQGTPFDMDPHQKIVDMFDNFFNVDFSEIKFVVFQTNKKALQGVVISGKENDKLLFSGPANANGNWTSSFNFNNNYGHVGAVVPLADRMIVFYTLDYYADNIAWNSRVIGNNGTKYVPSGTKVSNADLKGGFSEYSLKTNIYVYGVTSQRKYFVKKWEPNFVEDFTDEFDSAPNSDFVYDNRMVAACSDSVFAIMYRNTDGKVVLKFFNCSDGSEINTYTSSYQGYPGFVYFDGTNFYTGYSYDGGSGVLDYVSIKEYSGDGTPSGLNINGQIPFDSVQGTDIYLLDGKDFSNTLHFIGAYSINGNTQSTERYKQIVCADMFSVPLNATSTNLIYKGYLHFIDNVGMEGKIIAPSKENDAEIESFYAVLNYSDFVKGSMLFSVMYDDGVDNYVNCSSTPIWYNFVFTNYTPMVNTKTKLVGYDSSVFFVGEHAKDSGSGWYSSTECVISKKGYDNLLNDFPNY